MGKGLLVLLLCLGVQAGETVFQLSSAPEVQVVGGTATFGEAALYGQSGDPALPVDHITLLLPSNANLETIEVSLRNEQSEVVVGRFSVEPIAPLVNSSSKVAPQREKGDAYKRNELYPESFVRTFNASNLRHYALVDVVVQRYQYNPNTGILRALKGGELVVSYEQGSVRGGAGTESTDSILSEVVDNYAASRGSYASTSRRASTYLIATTSGFRGESLVLDSFIAIKENQGFNVEVITESTWGGGTGESAMHSLRAWLRNNYESKNIEYLFIIGDPNTTSKIPMTKGPTNSDDYPLIDYCYADLTCERLSDNPQDRMNDFDKYAELHVGRLPVYNGNVEQADKLLSKFISYATETTASAESWRFNALLPMANFSDAQNGVVYGEAIVKNILKPSGWSQFRVYKDHWGIPAEGYPLSYTNVRDYWNAGKFGVMIWQGHGLPTKTFSGPLEYVMDSPTATGITSENPSHCFQTSCHNGAPYRSDNLGYTLLKGGAISTIASAVEIWYSAMNTNYGSGGNGNDFGYIYAKYLVEDKLPTAAAFTKTRAFLPINGVQAWQNLTELNLYGCPATGVYTYGVSDKVALTHKVLLQDEAIQCISKAGVLHFVGGHITSVSLTDMRGRTYFDGALSQGTNALHYNSMGLASGIYVVQMKLSNGEVASQRVEL